MLREDGVGRAAGGVLVDPARLRSVRRLGVGPRADAAFDRIAGLVEQLIEAPVAVVTVIDGDRQLLPGQVGLPQPLATTRQAPLTHSFSRHVVESGRVMVVGDVRADPRLSDNPAIRDLGAAAFAGVPVTDPDGLIVGTLAVMDREPRQWTKSEITLLTDLAAVCTSEVGLRIARAIADEARRSAEEAHDQLRLLAELTEALTATMDIEAGMGRLGRMVAGRLADWCFVTLTDPTITKVRHVSAAHHDPAYAIDAARLAHLVETAPKVLKRLLLAVQRTGRLIREDRADAPVDHDLFGGVRGRFRRRGVRHTTPWMVIRCRAVMGVAGAAIMPASMALIGRLFPDPEPAAEPRSA